MLMQLIVTMHDKGQAAMLLQPSVHHDKRMQVCCCSQLSLLPDRGPGSQ
jgi:hypothetical protein